MTAAPPIATNAAKEEIGEVQWRRHPTVDVKKPLREVRDPSAVVPVVVLVTRHGGRCTGRGSPLGTVEKVKGKGSLDACLHCISS